jgi:hypothetical protein
MQDYVIKCQKCNAVLGYSDVPNPDNMQTKCNVCNEGYVQVIKTPQQEYEPAEFDVFVTNKRTAISKHAGFLLTAEEMQKKDIDAFIKKAAAVFVEMLSATNINQLLEQK